MNFDAITLTAITDELRTTLLGGRIQRVLLVDALSIGLEVYANQQRQHVLATANAQIARVHRVPQLSRGIAHDTPLLLLLRKYVQGGHIISIEQPCLERMLLISIAKEPETRNHHTLIIETMGRHSNIVLVDATGIIVESIKRVPPHKSSRIIMPHKPYTPPPAQQKHLPHEATTEQVAALCVASSTPSDLARTLVAGYCGISPLAAREVVYRALGTHPDATQSAWGCAISTEQMSHVAAALHTIVAPPWHPSVAYDHEIDNSADTARRPVAYAPYCITHLPHVEPYEHISTALDAYYAAQHHVAKHQQRADAIRTQLHATLSRLQRQQDQLLTEQVHLANSEQLLWEGNMILAFLHTIAPHQQTLDVDGTTITLDPNIPPLELAQKRFHAYNKAKSGTERIAERLETTRHQCEGIDALLLFLDVAEGFEHIENIAREAVEDGYITEQTHTCTPTRATKKRLKPLHIRSSDGHDIYVGRSGQQNDDVTFRIGNPEDVWLHVRGMPGAHVIVRSSKNTSSAASETAIHEAAQVAAYFSRARDEPTVAVDVTRRNKVRRVSGGQPGLVTCQVERTLRVTPTPPRID